MHSPVNTGAASEVTPTQGVLPESTPSMKVESPANVIAQAMPVTGSSPDITADDVLLAMRFVSLSGWLMIIGLCSTK